MKAARTVELAAPGASDQGRTYRIPIVAYWVTTLLVAQEMVAGSVWAFLRLEYVRVNLTHLGYPLYLLNILGFWEFPCAVALLVPRFGRLKEWAYAGAFFNYSGAVASHAFVGDGPDKWGFPLAFAVLALASWALRPPDRRTIAASPATTTPVLAWVVPIVVIGVLLVISLLTLPKGPNPW
jgi:hypothetical protein